MKRITTLLVMLSSPCFFCSSHAFSEGANEAFSSISKGDFERQLRVPSSEPIEPGSPLMREALATYAKLPFDIGERMRFVVTYMGVKAGIAEAVLRSPIKWKGSWAHRVTGEVKNADWYAWLVNLHDSVEGVFDNTQAMGPLRFYINQQEPVNFRQTKILDFDLPGGVVRQLTKRKERDEKREEFPLQPGTKDAMAALYYFRENIKPGQGDTEFQFPIFTSEKTWTAKARRLGSEKLMVEGHEYETDVYKLQTRFGQLMQQKGDIKLWMTADARRLPVYVEAAVKFGNIKVALTEWEQGFADPTKKKIFDKISPKK